MFLTPMSQSEFDRWAPRSRSAFAQDKIRANSLTQAEADKIADEAFARLLPDGLNSKDSFLFTAKDESQNIVGSIWYCVRGSENNRYAYICDIIVEEQYRGKGYGKKMMLFAENDAKAKGLSRIGLHVFGFNETAIGLYQSLGYLTTDLVMEKKL